MNNVEATPVAVSGLVGRGFRLEIQALRAIAVLAVLVFHIWPEVLPGGYVGVDVFFVISGYLITGVLSKQFSKTGKIHVRDFYVRRIRRLLPAAAVVLVAVAFVLPLLPQTRWEDNIAGIVASTLYVQNWWLAGQAVDYLAAESAPSAVMHFWSLSIEEQYYIAWPLFLMLLGMLPLAWRKNPGRMFLGLIIAVIVLSLGYSVWLTEYNPSLAYFSTLTRAWELAVGGLLAVTIRWKALPQGARDALAWVGLMMIGWSVLTYDATTAFPGYAAALPVVGTAFVLIGGESDRWFSAYSFLRRSPFQYLGDISYSLYLWHWPVIVFYGAISGRSPGWTEGIALAVISCALAHQTKMLVEDRFRQKSVDNRGALRAFGLAAGCIALSLLAAWAAPRPWNSSDFRQVAAHTNPFTSASINNPGAMSLTDGVESLGGLVFPRPDQARHDFPDPYLDECLSRGESEALTICQYGNRQSGYRVMLVGDTYAAQWQPALTGVANANGWRVDVAAKIGCALGDAVPKRGETRFDACEVWRRALVEKIRLAKPDLLIVAQSPSSSLMEAAGAQERAKLLAASMATFVGDVEDSSGQIVLVRSTPSMGSECGDISTHESCQRPRRQALVSGDPIVAVAEIVPFVELIDLTDGVCAEDHCSAVVGNVVVYRGAAHLTATYSRSLAPEFARALGVLPSMKDIKVPSLDALPVATDLPRQAVAAKRDNPDLYKDGCHVDQVSTEPKYCLYGDLSSDTKIVLAGDSHAAQWLPALQILAARNGWKLYSYTKSACAFSDTAVQVAGREYSSCSGWNEALMKELAALEPDVVVTSQSRGHKAAGTESGDESLAALAGGLVSRWGAVQEMGASVVVIAGTPWMRQDVPDCLSGSQYSPGACDTPRSDAERFPDSILRAVDMKPDVSFLSVNDRICSDENCPAIRGGVIMWRDRHHLTATFAESLAPYIEPAIIEQLDN